MDGWEVLAGINGDARRRTIAVVILTTFEAEAETDRGYDLQARGCLRKLGKWEGFADLMKNTADFRRPRLNCHNSSSAMNPHIQQRCPN
jgi:DNA-binding NarL/FixJ family response regulator